MHASPGGKRARVGLASPEPEPESDRDQDHTRLHIRRLSPHQSLLSRSYHRPSSARSRSLTRALDQCLQDSTMTDDPGGGSVEARSSTSLRTSERQWEQWWTDRLKLLEDCQASERLSEEARTMREYLSVAAYSLAANLLGLNAIPASSPRPLLVQSYTPPVREKKISSSGRPFVASSRKVSFSDIGFSLTAQPPSERSKPRRPGERRAVVLEEPSPYLHFLRRSDRLNYRAPWKPQLAQPDAVLLETRADQVVEELCAWMRQLETPELYEGGTDAGPGTTMTCEDVRKLFDICLEGPAARALAMHVTELGCVPETLAVDSRVPKVSQLSRVLAAVKSDLAAERRPRRAHAFGRTLPQGDSGFWRPPRNQTRERWRCDRVPGDLASMEQVFGGITHLKVTRDFSQYLGLRGLSLPPFLQQAVQRPRPRRHGRNTH